MNADGHRKEAGEIEDSLNELISFYKKKTKSLQGLRGCGAEPHCAKRKTKKMGKTL